MIMKALSLIFFMLIQLNISYSAKPVVELEPLLPNDQLELYEDSDNLFALKVMQYFRTAEAYRVQLILSGQNPAVSLYPPTIEELEELDIKIIKKYYSIAKALHDQVLLLSESEILRVKEENIALRRANINTQIAALDSIILLLDECADEKIKIIRQRDSIYSERLSKMNSLFDGKSSNLVTILSLSVSENLFLTNNGKTIENDPGLGVRLNLNLYKILGFLKGMDIGYEYVAPRITTISDIRAMPPFQIKEDWNTNLHSVGLSTRLSPIIESSNYSDGFKLGLGYFWTSGNIYNKGNGRMDWSGFKADVEYFAGNFSKQLPIELFLAISIYSSFNDDLVFFANNPGADPLNIGRTQFAASLGFRYNFWRSPF